VGIDDLIWPIAESALVAGAAASLLWALYARCFVPVPPNRALVLYGRRSARPATEPGLYPSDISIRPPRIVVGGGAYVAPWNKGVGQLSLDPIAVDVTVRSVHALEGSHATGWEVRLQVQARIPAEPHFLGMAAETLLGKSEEEIRALLRRSVEGAVPAVLVRLKSEEGEPDWDRLAAEIQASVAPDLVPWGLVVSTLSVTELRRIVPASPSTSNSPPKPVTAQEVVGVRGNLGALLTGIDTRLSRTERSLGILGAEILRLTRETPPALDGTRAVSIFDFPLGWEEAVSAVASEDSVPVDQDSVGGDLAPQSRPAPIGDRGRERGRGPWPPLE